MLAIDIIKVILFLAHEARFGIDICLAALDSLGEIFSFNEGYEQKISEIKQVLVESEDPQSGENGMAVLELLAFHENEEIRESASDLLENHLNWYI